MRIPSKKDPSVETLRGFAITLVVLGHVIGSDATGGMKVSDDSFLRYVYYTFEYLRMPLFTVISGWVYALRPVRPGDMKSFTLKKVRRILYPMVFVGAAYYIIQHFTPGTNMKNDLHDIWQILVFPYTLYWYLPSLFLAFVLCAFLDAHRVMDRWQGWTVVLVASALLLGFRNLYIPESVPNFFSFKGAIYLLPFFVIGTGIQRFKSLFANIYLNAGLMIILVAGLIVQQLSWFGGIDYELSKRSGPGLLIGISGTILFFRVKWNVPWLIWFGSYAYTIYLFHSFGTSGGRILVKAAGVTHPLPVFVISLLLGLLLPVVVEKVLIRFPAGRVLFLGKSYGQKKKPGTPEGRTTLKPV